MSSLRIDELGKIKREAYRILEVCDGAGRQSNDGFVRDVDLNHLCVKTEALNVMAQGIRSDYAGKSVPSGPLHGYDFS